MKALVIISEELLFEWVPEPFDWDIQNQDGVSWVDGENDNELIEAAKTRFSKAFHIKRVEIVNATNEIKQIWVYITSPTINNKDTITQIVFSSGLKFNRKKSEYADGILPH